MIAKSEALTRLLLTQEGVHEIGFANRGPMVDVFEGSDDLPGNGYAWCASFHQWGAHTLGFNLPNGSASVGILEGGYRANGWLISKPVRGCQAFWRIDVGDWPDHIFTVTKVLGYGGGYYTLRTIEGNTSPDTDGSQDNGGTVAQHTRIVHENRVRFGLPVGELSDEAFAKGIARAMASASLAAPLPIAARLRALLPTPKPPDEAQFWLWLRWLLGEREFKVYGPRREAYRPKVLPTKVPQSWWPRAIGFLRARNKGKTA